MSDGKEIKGKGEESWNFKIPDPVGPLEGKTSRKLSEEKHEGRSDRKKEWPKSSSQPRLEKKKKRPYKKKNDEKSLSVEVPQKKRTSRSRVAKDLETLERIRTSPRASIFERCLAGMIDLLWICALWVGSQFSFDTVRREVMKVLREQGINQLLPPEQFKMAIVGGTFFLLLLFLFILPTYFKERSLGKVLRNLRIGDEKNTASVGRKKTFIREIILRPLSFFSIGGVLLLFFSKKRQALHDILLGTTVFYSD